MADSPLEYVEMQRAVARFTTAVPIRDTLTDYQFTQYETAILGLCKLLALRARRKTVVPAGTAEKKN